MEESRVGVVGRRHVSFLMMRHNAREVATNPRITQKRRGGALQAASQSQKLS